MVPKNAEFKSLQDSCDILQVYKTWSRIKHLSILTPEGGDGELDNFEKSLTNSPPIGKNLVSKIPWMGHQICYII